MDTRRPSNDDQEISELDEAAQAAYEHAAADGLCQIGATEVALDAVRTLGLEAVVSIPGTRQRDHLCHRPAPHHAIQYLSDHFGLAATIDILQGAC